MHILLSQFRILQKITHVYMIDKLIILCAVIYLKFKKKTILIVLGALTLKVIIKFCFIHHFLGQ